MGAFNNIDPDNNSSSYAGMPVSQEQYDEFIALQLQIQENVNTIFANSVDISPGDAFYLNANLATFTLLADRVRVIDPNIVKEKASEVIELTKTKVEDVLKLKTNAEAKAAQIGSNRAVLSIGDMLEAQILIGEYNTKCNIINAVIASMEKIGGE